MAAPYSFISRNTTNTRDVGEVVSNDYSARNMSMNFANEADARLTAEEVVVAVAEKARPPVPLKKTHLNATLRMKKELDGMRQEKEQVEEMLELMEVDLVEAEDKLQKKDEELHNVKADLIKCEAMLTSWQEKAQTLMLDAQEGPRSASKAKQLNEAHAANIATKIGNFHKDEDLLKLQDQIAHLTASLAKSEAPKLPSKKRPPPITNSYLQAYIITSPRCKLTSTIKTPKSWNKLTSAQLQVTSRVEEVEERLSAQLKREKEQRWLAKASLSRLREQRQTTSGRESGLRQQAEEAF
ncbi:MAG: hypothetical protein Q9165_008916 [Trypethelium subeluteriae]